MARQRLGARSRTGAPARGAGVGRGGSSLSTELLSDDRAVRRLTNVLLVAVGVRLLALGGFITAVTAHPVLVTAFVGLLVLPTLARHAGYDWRIAAKTVLLERVADRDTGRRRGGFGRGGSGRGGSRSARSRLDRIDPPSLSDLGPSRSSKDRL